MALPTFAQTALELDEFFVNCVSDVVGGHVTLVRSGGPDKGYIMTSSVEGEATIHPAGESMTFLLMQDQNVVTFVVKYESLKYDMIVKGTGQHFDRGTCAAS